ncbi:MAG TPA: NAD(P)H-binding protein [Mycobacteriales bacterium]|nr:NAD(P)H-binding protein [Mycobacteriales bacterium]
MTEQRTILVTGATGNVGRHVVAGLREGGATVRALVRDPERAALPADVHLVPGDLTDPDSVAAAADGADAAFLLWPFFNADGAEKAVAALAGPVGRIVHLSASTVRDDRPPEQNGVWGAVERLVEPSVPSWTFLRAGGFATNTLGWAESVRTEGVVRLPYPEAGRSLIHERDIAAVGVRALLEDGHHGQKYVLTGPQTLTQTEQVRTIGAAIGRLLRIEEQSAETARQELLAQLGDPDFVAGSIAYWSSLVDNPEPVTRTVEDVLGRPALTFRDWAIDHSDDFR